MNGAALPTLPRVLLVDDDQELAALLAEYLRGDGFEVGTAADGPIGVSGALSGSYDIVVLDVMMPGMTGIEALRQIRAGSRLPVLMLTAKGSDIDRIIGLELGADDYVPKPTTPRELAARLRAILRRTQPGEGGLAALTVGALVMWPEKRTASWRGGTLELTSTEYNLLLVLAKNAGRVVGKAELSEQGLGRPLARFDRSIDVHLSSIRHKLGGGSAEDSPIKTVRGHGYQLVRE